MAITAGQPINASDFVASSAGAGDAGKGVKLDSNGLIDGSMIPDIGVSDGADVGATIPTTPRTNSSGKGQLHMVSIPMHAGTAGTITVDALVDSVPVVEIAEDAPGANGLKQIVFYVPPGSTYAITRGVIGTAGTGPIYLWKILTMP